MRKWDKNFNFYGSLVISFINIDEKAQLNVALTLRQGRAVLTRVMTMKFATYTNSFKNEVPVANVIVSNTWCGECVRIFKGKLST